MFVCCWFLLMKSNTMLLVAILTLTVVGCSYSNAQECGEGLYYADITNECVSECPCGFIGNSYTWQCQNDTYSWYQVYFNQTEYNFSVPITVPPGTKLGTAWISMPLSLISLEDGSLAPLENVQMYGYYNGLYLSTDLIPWNSVSLEELDFDFHVAGNEVIFKGGYGYTSTLNLTVDDVTSCGDHYILIPIDIYTASEFFGIGTYKYRVYLYFYNNNIYFHSSVTISIAVNSDCSSEQYYVVSTGQCVSECPCGTTPYPEFCYEGSNTIFSGLPEVVGVELDPQTPQGTNVFTYFMYLNISNGAYLSELDGNDTIHLLANSWGDVIHTNDGDLSVPSYFFYFHYYSAQFSIKLPGMEASTHINFTGPIQDIFPLSNTNIEQCSWGSTTFLKVPVEVHLESPYLYHLGTINVYIEGYVKENTLNYYYNHYFYSNLFITTNADCPPHLHYDFDSGSCVSECPCGFIGFDYHTPHYCEPAPNEAGWFGYWFYEEYLSPARFSETNYLLELAWNNPPKMETFEEKVFVYLDTTNFLQYFFTNSDAVIMAHVEVLYTGSSYTSGQGYGIDLPMVTLTGPTLPDSVNGTYLNVTGNQLDFILKNSSQYGLEYCYDELQERLVGYIPITVTVTSPQQYSLLANHSFVLLMTFSSPNDPFPNSAFLYYAYDTFNLTISITPGDIGQTPKPPMNASLEEGKDFYPFINVKAFQYSELEASLDGTSQIITIPFGLPFGNSIQTKAFVGTNGIISFGREWYFWYPTRFPTSYFWTRNGFVIAPFWNDHDLRKSGSVRYAVIDSNDGKMMEDLIKNVSNFLQLNHEQAAMDNFQGTWMLLVHWDQVHPYPHGSYYSYYLKYYNDYINRQNSYQAIVITDGADSYALFTYNCDQMEWTGYWQHGVVGYNAKGEYYSNHPSSGFEVVDTSVACANDLYGTPWNNVIFKTSLPPGFNLIAKKQCQRTFKKDQERIQSSITMIEQMLEPCPCTLWQAWRDWARFSWDWNNYLCFVQRFSVKVAVEEGTAYFTQQCCYSPWGSDDFGSLISSGQYAGSMLSYHPLNNFNEYVEYDKKFRDVCCGVAQMCDVFFKRRPSQNCSGYDPPTWTWGMGDPHITTLDGRVYTFNGWGEYVLLEYIPQGNTSAKFVMQARTTSVDESNPNAATQFSAFAFGIPGDLSFQIGIKESNFYVYKTSGTAEDISSTLATVNDTYNNTNGKAEFIRQAQESIIAIFSNGVGITINVTAGIPNFVLSLPSSFKKQSWGLLGNYNGDITDEFIPRHQDNALSDTITDQEIHQMFGQTWAVTEEESLFSYSLDSANFSAFQFPTHQPVFLDQLTPTVEQMEVCGSDQQCVYDYAQTGNMEIGLATMNIEQSNSMDQMLLANFPPTMTGDSTFRVTISQQAQYTFTVTDPEDTFSVGVLGGLPVSSNLLNQGQGVFVLHWTLQEPTNMTLTFFAKDSLNASSTLSPRLEVCACANGGECTLEGLLSTDATTIIMNCLCTQAFDGEFCEEDRNGCLDVVCYEGVECLDVPAPGLGAECGPCPPGLTGNGSKCFDVNECAVDPSICEQQCVNTEGNYTCTCWQGYQMDQEGICQDVDECLGVNDCQQQCENVPGSYTCGCSEGFELSSDGKSCNVMTVCSGSNSCSQICAIVNGIPTCFCNLGYELATESSDQCVDKDECELYSPCDQECTNLPGSFECSCIAGYELNENGITCTDIDECLEAAIYNIELCAKNTTCLNTEGGYECVCISGYTLTDGKCQREAETPPPIEQSTPPHAASNRLKVLITGLVPSTFTADRKQSFKKVTAELVTEYCSVNECAHVNINSKRRRQAVMVEPKHVALQNIAEDSEGRLVFYVYIELEEGILALAVIENALEGSEELYINHVDGITAIFFVGVSAPPTSPSPSPTTPISKNDTLTVTIVITAVGIVALIIIITVIVGVAINFAYHRKKSHGGKDSSDLGKIPLAQVEYDAEEPTDGMTD